MNEETNLQLAENPALLIAGVSHSFSKYQHVERLGTTETNGIEIGMYFELIKEVQNEGNIITEVGLRGSRTMQNPKRKLAYESLDKARQIGYEFGITPASENKVNSMPINEDDEFGNYLNK